jgi:hypothetical protein
MEFYTYLWLREDGTPYYVGKGQGRRAQRGHVRIFPPIDPSRILIQEFPSEADALEAEKFLISYYGRKDLGVGCLRNLTDGGEGTSGRRGCSEKGRQAHRETARRIGLKYGAINGERLGKWAIESGHLARLRTPEHQVSAARAAGRKCAENGHLERIRNLPQTKRIMLEVGQKAVESGQLAIARLTGNHNRWHVKRGIVNPDCNFCVVHHV